MTGIKANHDEFVLVPGYPIYAQQIVQNKGILYKLSSQRKN